MAKSTTGDKFFGSVLWLAGIASFVYGVGLAGYQCFLWLKQGYWTAYEISSLWEGKIIHSKWAGMDQITNWVASQSLAFGAILVGFVLFVVGNSIFEGK